MLPVSRVLGVQVGQKCWLNPLFYYSDTVPLTAELSLPWPRGWR